MSRLNEHEIARKLAEREDFEPPAGLLDKIKSEIPPEVSVGLKVPGERRSAMPPKQRWLIAASLIAMLGAGLFALRLRQEAPALESVAAPEALRAAEAPKAEAVPGTAPKEEREREREALQASPQSAQTRLQPSLDEERRQDAAAVSPLPPPPPPPMEAPPPPELAVEGGVEGSVAGGVVGGVPGGVVAAPVPGEIPKTDQEVTVTTESPLLNERRVSAAAAMALPEARRVGVVQTEREQLYDTVTFKSAGINGFTDTAADRLSTFGLDVDTASYTVARRYLTDGNLPDPKSVRVEEFVNFFNYGDPPPARGDFAIKAEGGPTPFVQGPQYRLVRFNIRGREMRADNRRPVVLTFVVDVSGSMDQENRLGLVKQSLSLLLDQLRPTDRIGLVTFGDQARVLLEPSNDREAVRQAIDRLRPEGSTNTEEGLLAGYDMAGRNFRMNAANRIILCSDGVANVGRSGPYAILGRIGREARRGIELTTLGFGMGNYNDHLMEQLADRGDGRYAYIDTLDEAKRVLVEELTGTLMTIAKDAKVQVEFNPAVVARYRLLGYENRAIADERFRDNTVDAGEIGAGHSVTALYEIELRPGAPADGLVAALHLRYRPEMGNQTETVQKLSLSALAPSWEKASPGFRLAALVAQFAEILKQSPWAKGDLSEVARQVREAEKALPKSTKGSEFADLVERAARIKTQGRGEE
jgi:Ca-activated chloride channel family protein